MQVHRNSGLRSIPGRGDGASSGKARPCPGGLRTAGRDVSGACASGLEPVAGGAELRARPHDGGACLRLRGGQPRRPTIERVLACLETALERWTAASWRLRRRDGEAVRRARGAASRGSRRRSGGASRRGGRRPLSGWMHGRAALRATVAEALVRRHRAAGLLAEAEPGRYAATPAATAWLKRRAGGEHAFRAQHSTLRRRRSGGSGAPVLVDLDESPVAALARRAGKGGAPWLQPHATAAAERLRRDFEIGRLQPRVTANWSASVSDGRRSGDGERDCRPDRHGARRAASLRPRHARRRPGAFRRARRRLLLPEGAGDGRARAAMAGALREAGAAPRAGRPGAPLRADGERRPDGRARARCANGARTTTGPRSRESDQVRASAASASARMRATIDERPFERCDVR